MELYFPIVLEGDPDGELQKRGCPEGLDRERWMIAHPQDVVELQQSFLMAGSRILCAQTAGANSAQLDKRGLSGLVRDANEFLAAVSLTASGTNVPVAGCLGPAGLEAEAGADASFEQLFQLYAQQAEILEEAGVRLFFIDAMTQLMEARAALLAVKSVSDKPALVSFRCDEQGRIPSGTDLAAALVVMQGMGAEGFGLVGLGPEAALKELERLRPLSQLPFVVRPSAWERGEAGEPRLLSPEDFAAYAPALSEQGAALFGGGPGVTAEHIQCLADCLEDCGINVPEPDFEELYPCSTPMEPCCLPQDFEMPQPISCGEGLSERLHSAQKGDARLLRLSIASMDQLQNFQACANELRLPLCLDCQDGELLEAALKIYQGRPLYTGPLSAEVLEPLQQKYGLIC